MTTFDDELRARFRELRTFERAGAPPFELPRARLWLRRGLRVAGASVALAAAVVAFVLVAPTRERNLPAMSITEWRAPTDALLQMPGTEWLSDVPTLTYEGTP